MNTICRNLKEQNCFICPFARTCIKLITSTKIKEKNMRYNIEKKCITTKLTCLECRYFDKTYKTCRDGMNKICFIYDEKTKTCIDGITKLPIKI